MQTLHQRIQCSKLRVYSVVLSRQEAPTSPFHGVAPGPPCTWHCHLRLPAGAEVPAPQDRRSGEPPPPFRGRETEAQKGKVTHLELHNSMKNKEQRNPSPWSRAEP